jgi:hypothetical protein
VKKDKLENLTLLSLKTAGKILPDFSLYINLQLGKIFSKPGSDEKKENRQ